VSIRELVNITHFTTAMAYISNNLTPNSDINMVIDLEDNIYDIDDSFEKGRGYSLLLSMHKPRSPSISSSKYSEDYYVCVKRDSDRIDEDEPVGFNSSIKVKFASQGGQKNQVSKTADTLNDMLQQHVPSKVLASNSIPGNSMFNINLNYNINQALDLEEWNGDFHTTSLHGAMEHLVSDIKNIKDSL